MKGEELKNFIGQYGISSERLLQLKVESTINGFENIFAVNRKIHAHIKQNSQESPGFNIFQFFDIGENKMSEILAFLLNPKSLHGQGDLYLREFCHFFGIFDYKEHLHKNVFVELEYPTDEGRRIDVLVKMGDVYLIIENKYRSAADQENQLTDYYGYLEKIAIRPEEVYIFYLTPYGEFPSNFTLLKGISELLVKQNRLRCIPFKNKEKHENRPSIIEYLTKCVSISKNHKMRFFIQEIIDHIREEAPMDKYKKEIFEWLRKSEDNTRYAHEIYSCFDEYRRYIINGFIKRFYRELRISVESELGKDWIVQKDDDVLTKWHGFKIVKQTWGNEYAVTLSNEYGFFNGLYYGLAKTHMKIIDEEKQLHDKICTKIGLSEKPYFTQDGNHIWWSWSKHLKNTWDFEGFKKLLEAEQEETSRMLINDLLSLARAINENMSEDIEALIQKLKG